MTHATSRFAHAATYAMILAVAAALTAGCGDARSNRGAAAAELTMASGPTVVMMGDSLTAGFALPEYAALPAQLEDALRAEGVAARFINAGVSGDTTAGGLERYGWTVANAETDMLILALGANDYLSGVAPQAAKANLAAIIERAQADGVAVVLIGLRPQQTQNVTARDAAFATIYPRLAQRYGVPLYPALLAGVRGDPALLQADGLHPTADGVALIASRLAEFVTPHLHALGDG